MKSELSKKYNRIKLIVSITSLLVDLFFWLVVILSGFAGKIADISYSQASNPLIQFLIFAAILGGIYFLINFPLSFYSGYILEHRFSLSNQTLAGWFREQMKAALVGLVLAGVMISIFYILLWKYPDYWWFGLWLFILVFSILLSRLAPVLLFPIFYKFTPLDDPDLRNRIKSFAEKYDLNISGVYQFDLSKNTRKANAAFTGLGKSRRVILGDTLLNHFNHDEIETIFAHEVGHYVKKHLVRGILVSSIISFIGLFLAFTIYESILGYLGYQPYNLEAIPYLALIFYFYSLISGPISNWVSRRFEYQADRFAVESSGQPGVYQNSLKKLADLNLADESPHPVIEFLFYSHPSISHRIEKISGEYA
ncbi:MAG: M48 family peptidase [Calditrichaeota bacterium]|nr:M48 family metallopeptidase [Calditrichota bacterium]RQV99447.1 MAG: M48 family peptidase [Calditrichota bacterium]